MSLTICTTTVVTLKLPKETLPKKSFKRKRLEESLGKARGGILLPNKQMRNSNWLPTVLV